MDRFTAAAPAAGALRSDSPAGTRALGRALGVRATAGTALALIGPLGAGKTQLAKGVADGLDVTTVVNSPTFVLMNEHVGRLRLFHVDAYRLDDPEEALAAGLFDERQADGVTVVEWADRLDGWLPVERLDLWIMPDPAAENGREIRWMAHGEAHARLAGEALR
ncbi:MAG TPA: tRNA (adenosine(37)-N6)-threonylcarbamoyltransferase complex ATPase subunit type 1 TsaE [Candidatus Dormibacteraeota bacterium]|jgi:tRNA threonylcarbamoyladenosine biosynthesis protein TsaE|nr:tRNA (adenosine(37)-N6)-threonylcarbamoyltransferase complex ATPase subunit type 1 TsaE [Candidatus Dormibacteraeota bacterium]